MGGCHAMTSVCRIQFLELTLVGIWITFQCVRIIIGIQIFSGQGRRTKGIFVGIQQDAVGVIVSGTSIGLQVQDILAGNRMSHHHPWSCSFTLLFFVHLM